MSYVKLDCGMLDSTIWVDREAREVFITALLMARPRKLCKPEPQIEVQTLTQTGFIVPPGWYGFVPASGSGIIHRARMELAVGLGALERLGRPEADSRTPAYEGRRLVRIDGGYVVLNFALYRDKDHTAALRAQRYRQRIKKPKRSKAANGKEALTIREQIREQVANDPITQADNESLRRFEDEQHA